MAELRLERPDRLPAEQVVRSLGSDPGAGLLGEEARARLASVGPNQLPPPPSTPLWRRVLRQLREPMAVLLVVAAAVSGVALGEVVDAVVIAAIVVANAVVALVEEGRAAAALAALRDLEVPHARVRRGGRDLVVAAPELVPGDLVLLEAGDRVPADLRLVRASQPEVDESMLTGESLPVAKDADRLAEAGASLGERPGVLHSGTFVTRGSAAGVVVATGERTSLGAIARQATAEARATPLQTDLAHVSGRLGLVALGAAAAVFLLTLLRTGFRGEDLQEAFLAAVALAVAAVPEGLATVTAVALALGVRRMAERGAIIRRLSAVETLGSASVLAMDKTGTLTENRMVLEAVAPPGGDFTPPGELDTGLRGWAERVAALCNDATLDPPVGDPTELALLEGIGTERVRVLRAAWPRLSAVPFDAERKRMTTVHRTPDGAVELLVKGAPESVLPRCATLAGGAGTDGTAPRRGLDAAAERAAEAARRGMRVLALAHRPLDSVPADPDGAARDLELVGLAGLRDPVRPAARDSVAEARSAGITLLMATGDHPGTALAIAEEVELSPPATSAVTGRELRTDGLAADPTSTPIYARVDPDQKLELVEALQAGGHVVAMTGDGVNDAPAVKEADIGVAMGITGSDVTKEAGDLVLADDNFATIVAAVEEGRVIADNIRKVLRFLLSCNAAEILVMTVAVALGLPLPLLAVQILWMNLVTDGLPALALGVEPAERGIMRRRPERPGAPLLRAGAIRDLLIEAALIAGATLVAFWLALRQGQSVEVARTMAFTTLVLAQLWQALNCRSEGISLLRQGVASNPQLLLATGLAALLQMGAVYLPLAWPVFRTAPLTAAELGVCLALAALVWPAVELRKLVFGLRASGGAEQAQAGETPASW